MLPLVRLAGLLRPYWRAIVQAVLAGGLVSVLAMPGPYITKVLVDEVYPRGEAPLLHFVLLGGAAIALGLGFVQTLSAYCGQRVGALMSLDLQTRLYAHVQGLDFAFFDGRQTGELLSRFDDLQSSVGHLLGLVSTAALNLLQALVFAAVLFWICWPLALISLALLPCDTALAAVTRRHYGRLNRAIAAGSASLSAEAYEALAGVRTVQALGLEAAFLERLRARLVEVARLQVRAALVQGLSGAGGTVLRAAGALAFAWYGWTQVLEGQLSLGTFLAFSAYVAYLYSPLQGLIGLVPQVEVARVHAQRFLELHDQRPTVRELGSALPAGRLQGRIEFRGVRFGFGDRQVLRGVDLCVPAGGRVAIVGRSGAGKSTLAKLVPRFYDPEQGSVTVDGVDVREYRLNALRRQIGFAMQGSCLFRGTIRQNLCLGQERPQADLEDAVRAVSMDAAIAALPRGLDTEVGEAGCALSEGQKQRLALARVLLLDVPVLILDEPAAALDPQSEADLSRTLAAVGAGRTVLLIAHRPQTIRAAERIAVLEGGRIAELGAHAELVRQDGPYARLFGLAAPAGRTDIG